MSANSWHDFRDRASQKPARIVLADGTDERVVAAAADAKRQNIADPVLIGSRQIISPLWKKHFKSEDAPVIDPSTLNAQDQDRYTTDLRSIHKFKTLTLDEARSRIQDPLVFGCLYTRGKQADGFIGGATRTTGDTLKAVFSIIGLAPHTSTLFGFFLIEPRHPSKGQSFILMADCAVTPEPSPKQLAHIAIGASAAYEYFVGDTPRVAFLSFSTHGSAEHEKVANVREAVQFAREKAPSLMMEGEWQADAALDSLSATMKGVGASPMAGKANILITPDLNCGNIAYKLVQRLGGCRAVGPVLWGTAQPANDLSRGCSSDDVLDMLALTSMQSQHTPIVEKFAHV